MTNINTIILLIYLILYQKPIQPEIQAVSTPYIQLIDGNEEQNKAVDYLWTKAHNIDIILTFYGESYLKGDVVHYNKLKDGTVWSKDVGYCQLNSKYHSKFINSPDFQDIYKQLDYCIDAYTKAIERGTIHTTFYAYDHRFEKRITQHFMISPELDKSVR